MDADLVKDVDIRQEMLFLPNDIVQELRFIARARRIKDTYVLVRMPKGLNLEKIIKLAGKASKIVSTELS